MQQSSPHIVTAQGLIKRYRQEAVVNGIDFSIPRGKCFGFLGPNGAGKTTTLRMLLGMTPMTAGILKVFGLDITTAVREIRARIGVVPQMDNLDPDFSVEENLSVYASYFGLSRTEIKTRLPKLLEFAALTEKQHAKTDTLSGGMKRRLTIARALINQPELVILDEPTTGLDPQARHVIWNRLNELRDQGVTLILTTHYMEEAERLCDELVIMDHGQILDHGTPKTLISKHVEAEVIEIRSHTRPLALQQHPELRIEQMGNSLYCYTDNAAALIRDLQGEQNCVYLHRPAGLEDVFLKLTGRELRD